MSQGLRTFDTQADCQAALPPTPTSVPPITCHTYWYFHDSDSNPICQQDQFCGAYMSQGLRTFDTQADCQAALPPINRPSTAGSGLTSDQVSQILLLLRAFQVDEATISKVQASLTGVVPASSANQEPSNPSSSLPSSSTPVPNSNLSFSYTWNNDLYYGMTNNADVKALQQALTLEKVYSGLINGNFWSLTRQAVIDFQKKHNFANIPNTGYVGSYTRQVLNSLYSK
jgi:hypothetical protein